MFIDPSLGGPILEPLLRLQASSNYTVPYAAADLGVSCVYIRDTVFILFALGLNYPNVSGSNSNNGQGIERSYFWFCLLGILIVAFLIETGNMLIMILAYVRANGDVGIVIRYVRQPTTFSLIGTDGLR